ncbi:MULTISPECIES: hypothetical protein [Sphingobacterium]|uniref:Uncharacterized protein n=1 Tax=Sphingobacterium cellulitidis TaxID=1768011 RepID=A0A8H9G4M9_9SPHI|nr:MULTISPECIES: hypothetical protein [Sphingobacterium]MBA8988512.1 lipopolysaccharide export LptBFGC system permease protein LptF [Sphingobacterium soli]OYD41239.1 hypothetical protein CHT99_13700 [Sphingobacterium cellulitidis]OYD45998.1 hypothetical protein CHU00_09760 [Sphingobacterium cellulitidis]WFB62799.1 hypothetical protein PZ892_14110 [Sphingobacterium sp. WM]GGE33367.1 hypothetical protein GCM10011516_33830 [Sphingobacterium soli]
MDRIRPFITIPIILIFFIWGSTQAFHLLSAASDWDVFVGVCLALLLIAILYKFIIYILKK